MNSKSVFFSFFKYIFILLGSDKKRLPILLLIFILASVLELLSISLIGPFISVISNPEGANDLFYIKHLTNYFEISNKGEIINILSAVVILVFALKSVSIVLINKRIFNFSFQQELKIRMLLINSIQEASYESISKANSSDYLHSVQILAGDYARGLIGFLKTSSDLISSFFILLALYLIDPLSLSILMFLMLFSTIIFQVLFRERIVNFGVLSNKSLIKLIKNLNETLFGIKEIRVFGKEEQFREKLNANAKNYAEVGSKYALISSLPRYFFEFILIFVFVIIVLLNSYLNKNFDNFIVNIGIFGVASLRLIPSATQILSTVVTIQNTHNSLFLLIKRLSLKKDNFLYKEGKDLLKINKINSVEIDNLKFKFEEDKKYILENISLRLNSGDTIGIYGASGSGKTTLINCLIGLYQPTSGVIKVNGEQINANLKLWQNQLAYLPQNVFVIDDSLAMNIALGEKNYDIDKVQSSLKKAKLYNSENSMGLDINKKVGENGMMLSGGQKQRLALARAFYFERKILILDESTNALDSKTEKEIIKEINSINDDTIKIIISHDKNLLRNCDKTYKLVSGALVKKIIK